jgi:ASPIC/UnbV protein/VCBS repeat protein
MKIHFLALMMAGGVGGASGQILFADATEAVGLGELRATRVVLVDLDGDTRPDIVVDRTRVFMNRVDEDGGGVRFVEVAEPGLPVVNAGDCLVFADIDNDGLRDAIVTRMVTDKLEEVLPTAWLAGNGDGTFGEPVAIEAAEPKTTACVAVGDVDGDGWLDLYLGNWYTKYGQSVEAFYNDLLMQTDEGVFERDALGEDQFPFSEDKDAGGRPTYGAMIVRLQEPGSGGAAQVLELSYGRRANRLWHFYASPSFGAVWIDEAPARGLDADEIRHGRYPEWLEERAKTDSRFDREDEKPFRSNGNTFDAAIGDVNNDGRFDVLLTTIAHGWAGESSDRTRLLLAQPTDDALGVFAPATEPMLDRVPKDPAEHRWNQGDLFGDLADFDNDGRMDVMLSSGDYPDNQRLRVWRQLPDGVFADVTSWSGLDNDGSQQISFGDLDLDGDVDVVVGQSFNRYPKAKRAGRTPTLKVYLSQAVERGRGHGLGLVLKGDPSLGVSRDALGAVVEVVVDDQDDGSKKMLRQLIGIGGHAGKQHAFELHFGLGKAQRARRVTIWWPGRDEPTVLGAMDAGRHVVDLREVLEK